MELRENSAAVAQTITAILDLAINVKSSSSVGVPVPYTSDNKTNAAVRTDGVSALQQNLMSNSGISASANTSAKSLLDVVSLVDSLVATESRNNAMFLEQIVQQVTAKSQSSSAIAWWYKLITRHILNHQNIKSASVRHKIVNFFHNKLRDIDSKSADDFKRTMEQEIEWVNKTKLLIDRANRGITTGNKMELKENLNKWDGMCQDSGTIMCVLAIMLPDILKSLVDNYQTKEDGKEVESVDSDARNKINDILTGINQLDAAIKSVQGFKDVNLGDGHYFLITDGKKEDFAESAEKYNNRLCDQEFDGTKINAEEKKFLCKLKSLHDSNVLNFTTASQGIKKMIEVQIDTYNQSIKSLKTIYNDTFSRINQAYSGLQDTLREGILKIADSEIMKDITRVHESFFSS